MKNLITYPSHQAASKPSEASRALIAPQSRFNAVIALTPMQDFIDYLGDKFARVMTRDCDYRELCRLGNMLKKARRKLDGAKAHNFKTGLKWNMLRRPDWRNKVLEDLGGEAALAKWDAKVAKADMRAKNFKPYVAPVYKRPPLASLRLGAIKLPPIKDVFDVKTDASGAFRLAPIPNVRATRPDDYEAPDLTQTQIWERKEGWRLRVELRAKQYPPQPLDESTLKGYWYKDETTDIIYRVAPIPLLPDELRGIGIEVPEDDDADAPPPRLGTGPENGLMTKVPANRVVRPSSGEGNQPAKDSFDKTHPNAPD